MIRLHFCRFILFLSLLFSFWSGKAATCHLDSAMVVPQLKNYHLGPLSGSLRHSIPLVGASLLTLNVDHNIRELRKTGVGKFHTKLDNFSQFLPLATQLAMRGFGCQGRSDNWGQLLTADALGMLLMTGMVNLGKNSFGRMRPDESSANSYPSGHTATAFACATLFHLEYGARSPLYSVGGFTIASLTGLSRVVNNRHWASDVLCGAAVGIFAAELGYWLSDMLFHRQTGYNYKLTERQEGTLESTVIYLAVQNKNVYQPIRFAHFFGERRNAFGINMGLNMTPGFARWLQLGTFCDVSTENIALQTDGQPEKSFVSPAISAGLSAGVRWHPWKRTSLLALFIPSVLFRGDFILAEDEEGEMPFKLSRHSGFLPIVRLGIAQELTDHMGLEVHGGYQFGRSSYSFEQTTSPSTIIEENKTEPYQGLNIAIGLQFYPFRD